MTKTIPLTLYRLEYRYFDQTDDEVSIHATRDLAQAANMDVVRLLLGDLTDFDEDIESASDANGSPLFTGERLNALLDGVPALLTDAEALAFAKSSEGLCYRFEIGPVLVPYPVETLRNALRVYDAIDERHAFQVIGANGVDVVAFYPCDVAHSDPIKATEAARHAAQACAERDGLTVREVNAPRGEG